MKKNQKLNIKLTPKDFKQMWGGDGPYSQVNLIEQTRILDDSVSRIFLVVEAEINPFTFEYISKNRNKFLNDEPILQLLDHAEYRGDFGYVVSAGEVELSDEESKRFARKQAKMTTETLIRMHEFVNNEFSLKKENKFETTKAIVPSEGKLVWNENLGGVEIVDDGLADRNTLIGSPFRILYNRVRFFVVLVFNKKFDFSEKSVKTFASTLKVTAEDFNILIEDCESFYEYVLITIHIPFDTIPVDFVETVIKESNKANRTPIFIKDHLATSMNKPKPEQIMGFLKNFNKK